MPCHCADHWGTSQFAREKNLEWRVAAKSCAAAVATFISTGGTTNESIDRFAKDDLVKHAGDRFSNTHLLLDAQGTLLAFVSNSMGTVRLKEQEMWGMNTEFVPEVPALFLHRLGVHHSKQQRGLGRLCAIRVFEILRHTCSHTAAFCVALYVDPNNASALKLYGELGFQAVETEKPKLKLMILGYPEAVDQVTQFENVLLRGARN